MKRYILILLNIRRVARVIHQLEVFMALDGKPATRHKEWEKLRILFRLVPQQAKDGRTP